MQDFKTFFQTYILNEVSENSSTYVFTDKLIPVSHEEILTYRHFLSDDHKLPEHIDLKVIQGIPYITVQSDVQVLVEVKDLDFWLNTDEAVEYFNMCKFPDYDLENNQSFTTGKINIGFDELMTFGFL